MGHLHFRVHGLVNLDDKSHQEVVRLAMEHFDDAGADGSSSSLR